MILGNKAAAPKVVPKKSATAKPVPKSSLKNKKQPQAIDSESGVLFIKFQRIFRVNVSPFKIMLLLCVKTRKAHKFIVFKFIIIHTLSRILLFFFL